MKKGLSILPGGLAVAIYLLFPSTGARAQALGNLLERLRDARENIVEMNAPFDPNPTDPNNSQVDKVLVYARDADGNAVPVKTLKITNLHTDIVFPIMRDGNEAALQANSNIGLYDPYDAVRTEYRGYIGFRGADGKHYFGLRRGESILVRIPLVFWNGARIGITTEGEYLTPVAGKPNPLNYNPNAQMIIVRSETDMSDSDIINNGVVLWYKAPLGGPALDSPDQLAEWTIRDQVYLSSKQMSDRTHNEIAKSEKVNLINYDISYVDNLFLPAAMEALDVPIPKPPYPPGENKQPYGWIGAVNKVKDLQDNIAKFTASNNALLGTYFGSKGWPIYNIPMQEKKIPAGQNVFAQSPLADVRSSYNNNTYMLSSGGGPNDPIFVNIGGGGTASSGTTLTLSRNEDIAKIQFIQQGYLVIGHPPLNQTNPIQDGTKVVSVNVNARTVQLDKPLVALESGSTFDFFRPANDYASDAMIKLWYSWAKLYLDDTAGTSSQTIPGCSILKNSATLKFNAAQSGLVLGMQVKGPNLPDPDPSKSRGGVVILQIAEDGKSVTLSQLASEDSANASYNFIAPQPLPSTPASLFSFNFSSDPAEAWHEPHEFAKKVYLIMSSMAQIAKQENVKAPHVLELMNNVIGGNMGFIFATDEQRFSEAGLAISAVIRDMIKSVLRGVTDFTKFPEFDQTNNQIWYPDPKRPRGGQSFNVYNLDPFVWFVHVVLGFSGYGFSLDDDTADVGAGEATKLLLTIGGPPTGREGPTWHIVRTQENANEWKIQAPYGPVIGRGMWDPNKTQKFFLAITNATNTEPIVITSVKHGLANGDTVSIDQVEGNTAANTPPNGQPFTITNVTANTFELVGTKGNGAYTGGGRWTTGPLPYITFGTNTGIEGVYWRVKGDDKNAGFQGALITGPGVQSTGSVRVVQLGDDAQGLVAISKPLTRPNGDPLPAGRYTWTLSGN